MVFSSSTEVPNKRPRPITVFVKSLDPPFLATRNGGYKIFTKTVKRRFTPFISFSKLCNKGKKVELLPEKEANVICK